jgi:hypothetical protein
MPYRYEDAIELENSEMVGDHECVALVKRYAGTPNTSLWKQGSAVLGNLALQKGTAIATFEDGKYQNRKHGNHAALYLGQVSGGIRVMDQWRIKKDGLVTSRIIRAKGKNNQGRFIQPSDNADAFFVIE